MEQEVIGVVEAGRRFGLLRAASYNAVRRGQLPAIRFGRKLVCPVKVIERMLETGLPASEVSK